MFDIEPRHHCVQCDGIRGGIRHGFTLRLPDSPTPIYARLKFSSHLR
jgi:hypothetical protein